MAANYTRLIEFKVKDTELNRAVKNLSKSLNKIDKTLVGIDKKLDHIARFGFAMVSKEANKAEKSVGRLAKAMKAMSSPQGLARGAVSGAFGLLGGKKGEIARRVAELYAFDGVLRKLTNGSTGLPAFNRRVTEAATALAAFGVAHAGAITGISIGGLAIIKGTKFFYDLGKGVRQAEANLIDFIKTSKQVGVGTHLKSFLPKAAPGSRLGGADSGREMSIDGAAMHQATQLTGQSSSIQLDSLRARRQALENNKKIQENLVALTGKHLRASVQVRDTQIRYNLELAKTKLVQAAVTADIWAAQKAWQGVVGVLKGAQNLVGGLFGGKFGKAGQAAGVITLSRSIEFLTGKLGFLNNQWVNNAKAAAQWTTRVTEAVATVNIAYTGLTKVLGAANWTIGAIAGFKKWESEASQAIWRVDRQARNLVQSLGAAFWMMQGKGGTPGGVAQNLKNMALGGEERRENIRYAGQGPTELQNLQRDLDLQATKLKQRNIGEADYIKILQRQKQIKLEMLAVEDNIKTKRIEAGVTTASEQFKEEYDAFKDQVDKKTKAAQKAANDITKLEKQEAAQRKKLQTDAAKNYERLERDKEQKAKQRHKDALKRERTLAAETRRRQRARKEAMGRFGENVMLGAGFPLLFGGGVGSVAGGLTGAIGQSALGSRGFGMQIFFSAIGQQVDAFAAKATELGKALRSPTEALSKLAEMGIQVDKALEKQVQTLIAAGKEFEAQRLVNKEVAKVIGRDGVKALKALGVANEELMTKANKLRIKIMSEVAPAFMTLIDLAGQFVDTVGGHMLRKKAEELDKGAYEEARRSVAKQFGFGELAISGEARDKYWRLMTEESKGIIAGKQPGWLGKEQLNNLSTDAMGKGLEKNPMALTDLEQKDLQILEKRIELLKMRDGLSDKELYKKQESILISERDRALQEAINNEKSTALIMKEYDLKFLELEQGYLEKVKEKYAEIGGVIKDGMVSAIESAIDGTQRLGEIASNVLRQIAKAFIQAGITSAFGPEGLNIPGFAKGGPVTGGDPYIVGEKGPELFVPKGSGTIVPNDDLGGGVSVVVNVDATGGSEVQGDEPSASQLGRLIGAAVQAELIKQKRPGGILA